VSNPGRPQRPRLLICDTDVVLQLIIADAIPCLFALKRQYAIQPMVVDRVQHELDRHAETKFRFYGGKIRKALRTILEPLARSSLARVSFEETAIPALLNQIELEAAKLSMVTDLGEAYSHAAANALNGLIASNDSRAISDLRNRGYATVVPVLRACDIIVFGLQVGAFAIESCEQARKQWIEREEYLPACFQNKSFAGGLPAFYQRLADSTKPLRGLADASSPNDVRVLIDPIVVP
jgi:hypothetical protein